MIKTRTWGQVVRLPRGTYLASKGKERVDGRKVYNLSSSVKNKECSTRKCALRFIGSPKKRY
jgi:hypothetical protein